MNQKEEKIDKRLRELFSEIPLEGPSEGFTSGVLKHLEPASSRVAKQHTPLFSWTSWFLVITISVLLIAFGFLSGGLEVAEIDANKLLISEALSSAGQFLPNIANSAVLVYSMMALILCFSVQILWFTRNWNRRRIVL
ncbi:hypothetical protein [Muriicola soli]|uniref:DUF5056 domain-containing protein n=1 Tax=Muriicola soli TaxID=2507538 RepID=A0A411E803_9FLAO|nr:hypothetical protein [Muriicola soli]QBA63590.1 hypothetical protein EQY75_02910 [Muriicola soli]